MSSTKRKTGKIKVRAVSTFMSKGQRAAQEDHVLVDREKGFFIVADGFGGVIPGAQASQAACESVRGFLFRQAGDQDATLPFVLRNYFSLAGNVLYNALIYANRKLSSLNSGKNVNERGGSSVLAAYLDGDLLAVANVGVCSAWLVRDGKAVELVMPRSFGRLLDPFQSSSFNVSGNANGNERGEASVPLIALGMAEDLEPEIFEYRVKVGDCLILCTDGVSEVTRTEIFSKLNRSRLGAIRPEDSTQEVVAFLNQQTFSDNVSISLIII